MFNNFSNYKSYFKQPDHEIWHEVKDKILSFKPEWVKTIYKNSKKHIRVHAKLEITNIYFYILQEIAILFK